MSNSYYIASCVFTSRFPQLSFKIQEYVQRRWHFPVVRCCIPGYKIREFEEKMPEGKYRDQWSTMQDSVVFSAGDDVYSLCHNCNNIIEEMRPGARVHSLWELIDQDDSFEFRDYTGLEVTVQDCWRARDRMEEQDAVRSLLTKMHINYREVAENRETTKFCGNSLYRPQPPRNPKLAPKHYREGAKGLFVPHTLEEQKQIMQDYCSQFETRTVICYCHYCLEGLLLGGVDGRHIAQLLFDK